MSAELRVVPEPVVFAAHDPRDEIAEAVLRRVGPGYGRVPGPVFLVTWDAARRHRFLGPGWWPTPELRACLDAAADDDRGRTVSEAVIDIVWKNVEGAEMRALNVAYLSEQLFIND